MRTNHGGINTRIRALSHQVSFRTLSFPGMMRCIGIGFGFTSAMPYAIVPDAVEYDSLLSGARTEGALYGMRTFSIKIGQAIAGFVRSFTGCIENAAQTPLTKVEIRLLLGSIPAAIFITAIIVLSLYPMTAARYAQILEDIEMEDKRS